MLFSKSSIVPKGIKGYKNLHFPRFSDSNGKGVKPLGFLYNFLEIFIANIW